MPDTSLIGQTLAGRYRITGVIGEGGMATVYRGQQEGSPRNLAIKIMNPELAKESRFVRRFKREARAHQMLKHPNTVHIIEAGVDEGFVFLAMELLEGFDLAMLLHRERRIPQARAVQIVVQVCRALSAAHEQSIVHRDLKPDNIMLIKQPAGAQLAVGGMSPNDFVKVLDFGIAKILDDDGKDGPPLDPRVDPITQEKSMLTRVGTIVGTPAYMAPEQGRAEAVDARTDIYAVGVLLYELTTGRVPFTGETPMQVVMRHVNEPARPPSDFVPLHPELNRLIMRALAKWPSERQQSAEEMAFELLAVLPLLSAAAPEAGANNRTLVIERPSDPPPAPRPAAGAPPPRPAAGAPPPPTRPTSPRPAAGAPPSAPGGRPPASVGGRAHAQASAASAAPAFPTLNIEVPDDIFPMGGIGGYPGPGSSDPAPTQRTDVPPTAPAAPSPARQAPPPPVIPVGIGRDPARVNAPLASTLTSAPDESDAPADSDDDLDDARTIVKQPSGDDAVPATMMLPGSIGHSGGPGAPGGPPPNLGSVGKSGGPGAPGYGLPKVAGPESVEPTLLAKFDPKPGVPPPAAAPPRPARDASPPASQNLRGLVSTVRVDASEVDRIAAETLAARASNAGAASGGLETTQISTPPGDVFDGAPAGLGLGGTVISPGPVGQPGGPGAGRPGQASKLQVPPAPEPPNAANRPAAGAASSTSPAEPSDFDHANGPARKPTGEIIPVTLPEDVSAKIPPAFDAPAVWQPKGRKLSGPTALILGIVIGALLFGLALVVILAVKR